MPSTSLDALSDERIVAEAKKLYAQAEEIESKADSLKSQASEKKWAVADRCLALSQRGWGQRKIASAIGMSQMNVSRYVRVAASESVPVQRPAFGEAYELVDPSAGTIETYRRHTAALAKQDPESAVEIVAKHAPEQVRAASTHTPNPVGPRADHLLYQYEGKLTTAETNLRQALAILAETDQPGDDEDILDQINRIRQLVEVNEEAYRTGKSLDTWAAELEGSAG